MTARVDRDELREMVEAAYNARRRSDWLDAYGDRLLALAEQVLAQTPASDEEMFAAMRAGNCTLVEAWRAAEAHHGIAPDAATEGEGGGDAP